jgi:hypothetical protein
MATQSANGFQTGLTVFPSAVAISSSGNRNWLFNAFGGILGGVGITWGLSAASKGTITAGGLYTAPSSVSSPSVDQVLATAIDGSQAQAFVSLFP